MTERPRTGGDPHTFGRCVECGAVYPVQRVEGGGFRPVGTEGTCECGGGEFEPVSDA
jgi:hypothetical protein